MKKAELVKKMIQLESMNEALLSEIYETDQIMRRIGFSNGLATVKAVAYEMKENNSPDKKKLSE